MLISQANTHGNSARGQEEHWSAGKFITPYSFATVDATLLSPSQVCQVDTVSLLFCQNSFCPPCAMKGKPPTSCYSSSLAARRAAGKESHPSPPAN